MSGRLALAVFICLWLPSLTTAAERINSFDVMIEVQTDGDLVVTERINVRVEGNLIKRGIFRDLPRYHDADRVRIKYDYLVLSVLKDGEPEPYLQTEDGNAFQIRIGNASVFLAPGDYTYELKYLVKNQVRYFDGFDEVYWNATGTYWSFPIETASTAIILPAPVSDVRAAGYTGRFGTNGMDYEYEPSGPVTHVFRTTRPLRAREGLTVALGFEKGVIDAPTEAEQRSLWWQRNGALIVLGLSMIGIFWFYWSSFNKVGRDPVKPPVIPRYGPPEGYSPAAVHHIFNRMISGHSALISTLMHAATKGYITIDASDDSKTKLAISKSLRDAIDLSAADRLLLEDIFDTKTAMTLGGKYNAAFTEAYTVFQKSLGEDYGVDYFRWNIGIIAFAVIVSIIAFAVSLSLVSLWTTWHTVAVLALAIMNAWFMYLIPAPTEKGQKIRTEIEGFRLYMETAEKLQLNSAEVGKDTPPVMTTERYERFLPYAIALGVEEPWTEHFERQIPQEAEQYNPHWNRTRGHQFHSLKSVNAAVVGSLSSGVASALPQSSSSSGSGGGGFSGGGGGGGGGGGW